VNVREAWGMRCPSCPSDDGLDITITTNARLTPEGTDINEARDRHQEWDDDSPCSCAWCGWSGKVKDAKEACEREKLPQKGEIWEHTETGRKYAIVGTAYNVLTDKVDVQYKPLYPSTHETFVRQATGHPKAFLSNNENGEPRFRRVHFAAPGSIP